MRSRRFEFIHKRSLRGIFNSLVARYVGRGWLVSPVRGVYMRAGGRLQWDGVVAACRSGRAWRCMSRDASRWPCKGTSTTCVSAPPGGVDKLSME
ncbi:AbiEi antitoxin N-terminal domain-containing protein [Halotalea alkalilenta]|uniref:AbiEi antitoxin N-terminal domain-containing protein n=1 Tax=Halotalea alkalilenta TaxID=376489 RepID=UPI003CCC0750